MHFIDLHRQQTRIRDKIEENIKGVLDHGQYILGPEVQILEKRLARLVGTDHCVGVASGTDALLISLMAIGIKAGDEIIVPAFSFVATVEVVALLGAKPVFIDVNEETYTLDHTQLKAAVTQKTKAIIPVSLYGQCANMNEINSIAAKRNLIVIEDAAQSLGAKHRNKQSCSLSTIGCTSFFPSKPLGAYGDGGACFTDNAEIATRIRQISVHGQDKRYHHAIVGINGRLDTLQAAILLAKLDIFDEEIQSRSKIGLNYINLLSDTPNIILPETNTHNTHVYAQFTIRVNNRNKVISHLNKCGIPTAIHYPIPLHKQPAYLVNSIHFPVTERLSEEVISLPMHPYISKIQQLEVANAVKSAINIK